MVPQQASLGLSGRRQPERPLRLGRPIRHQRPGEQGGDLHLQQRARGQPAGVEVELDRDRLLGGEGQGRPHTGGGLVLARLGQHVVLRTGHRGGRRRHDEGESDERPLHVRANIPCSPQSASGSTGRLAR